MKIPTDRLVPHPDNANVMSPGIYRKLRRHIEQSGRYEPLVVRPLPGGEGAYQIINGHHRWRVLRELGRDVVDCQVWDVDDDQAQLLLATLNRLSGHDDPTARADLLADLRRRFPPERLAQLIPETPAQLDKLLAIREPAPALIQPSDLAPLTHHLSFFVSDAERAVIERSLRAAAARGPGGAGAECSGAACGPRTAAPSSPRGRALAAVARFFIEHHAQEAQRADQ